MPTPSEIAEAARRLSADAEAWRSTITPRDCQDLLTVGKIVDYLDRLAAVVRDLAEASA